MKTLKKLLYTLSNILFTILLLTMVYIMFKLQKSEELLLYNTSYINFIAACSVGLAIISLLRFRIVSLVIYKFIIIVYGASNFKDAIRYINYIVSNDEYFAGYPTYTETVIKNTMQSLNIFVMLIVIATLIITLCRFIYSRPYLFRRKNKGKSVHRNNTRYHYHNNSSKIDSFYDDSILDQNNTPNYVSSYESPSNPYETTSTENHYDNYQDNRNNPYVDEYWNPSDGRYDPGSFYDSDSKYYNDNPFL